MTADALLLNALWILPLLTAVAAALPGLRDLTVKRVHAGGALLSLLIAALLTLRLYPLVMAAGAPANAALTLYHETNLPWFPAFGIHFHIGVDALSMLLVLLTAIIVFCGILASWQVETQVKEFFFLLQLLATGVYGAFISFDLFTFFFFYEMEAIAMYLLIAVWGTGRREYCALKLVLMLIGGSALVLVGILGLYISSGLHTFDLPQLATVHFAPAFQYWAFPVLFVGFAVSAALFPFHTWSPDGHSAAPTAVSMLAAGVMMKLGTYGCLRIAMFLLPEGTRVWMPWLLWLIAANVVLAAFIAIRQTDLKYITAYSSISHLGLIFLGLAAGSYLGLKGAALQMISHGFLTGLFFATIGMLYGRTHTRQVTEQGGLMKVMPFIGVGFVLAGFAGLGLPTLSGFVAEATIFLGAFQNSDPAVRFVTVLGILGITTTAVYVLRAANAILHGPLFVAGPHPIPAAGAPADHAAHAAPADPHAPAADHAPHGASSASSAPAHGLTDADAREKLIIVILVVCLFGMGCFPGWIANMLDTALLPIFRQLSL